MKKLLSNNLVQIGLILIILFIMSFLQGCEYQTETQRRIAFFYKTENGGKVSDSRDISSFTHKRSGNKTDQWLRKQADKLK